jgi:hypothetical protein
MKKTWFLFVLINICFLLGGAPLPALSSLELDGGLLFLASIDPQGAPSPLLPTVGLAFPLLQRGGFALESAFLLFGTYYKYEDGRASPVEQEHREYAVPAILADVRAGYGFRLGGALALGGDVGLALLLRFPIPLSSSASEEVGSAFGYLFGAGRFFYPETGLSALFRLPQGIGIRIALRAFWPVFLLWGAEDLPFPEGLLVTGLVGLVFELPGRVESHTGS